MRAFCAKYRLCYDIAKIFTKDRLDLPWSHHCLWVVNTHQLLRWWRSQSRRCSKPFQSNDASEQLASLQLLRWIPGWRTNWTLVFTGPMVTAFVKELFIHSLTNKYSKHDTVMTQINGGFEILSRWRVSWCSTVSRTLPNSNALLLAHGGWRIIMDKSKHYWLFCSIGFVGINPMD